MWSYLWVHMRPHLKRSIVWSLFNGALTVIHLPMTPHVAPRLPLALVVTIISLVTVLLIAASSEGMYFGSRKYGLKLMMVTFPVVLFFCTSVWLTALLALTGGAATFIGFRLDNRRHIQEFQRRHG